MTYRQLRTLLAVELEEEQLDQDVTVAIVEGDEVEVCRVAAFINPNMICSEGIAKAAHLPEIDDSILDKGHPYMIIHTSEVLELINGSTPLFENNPLSENKPFSLG